MREAALVKSIDCSLPNATLNSHLIDTLSLSKEGENSLLGINRKRSHGYKNRWK